MFSKQKCRIHKACTQYKVNEEIHQVIENRLKLYGTLYLQFFFFHSGTEPRTSYIQNMYSITELQILTVCLYSNIPNIQITAYFSWLKYINSSQKSFLELLKEVGFWCEVDQKLWALGVKKKKRLGIFSLAKSQLRLGFINLGI